MLIGPSAGRFYIRGASDNTLIGNVDDNLKTRSSFGPESLTAFGRLKASLPNVIYEYNFTENDRSDLFDSSTAGGGSVTYNSQEAVRQLNVGTLSGDEATIQTFQRIKYTPGQQNSVIFVNHFSPKANTVQESCYCDGNDGLFFRMTGLDFSVGIKNSISGSVVENEINQDDFNGDKLDGTGESGIVADFTTPIIFFIQFQWLGAGSVFFWASIDGKLILLHTENHSNIISDSKYMRTATLPFRFSIKNTATTASATTMKVSCGASISEGVTEFSDTRRFVFNESDVTLNSNGAFEPLIAIRLKSTSLVANLKFIKSSVFATTADEFAYEIVIGGTLTGGTWSSVDSQSAAEVNKTATNHTGGIIISGDISSQDGNPSVDTNSNYGKIGKFINGDSQILVLRARTLNNNANVHGSITFEEIY